MAAGGQRRVGKEALAGQGPTAAVAGHWITRVAHSLGPIAQRAVPNSD